MHVLGSQRRFQSSAVYRGFRLYRLRRVRNRQLGRTRNRVWDRRREGAQEPLPALEIAVVAVKGGQVVPSQVPSQVPSRDHPSSCRFPGVIKDFLSRFGRGAPSCSEGTLRRLHVSTGAIRTVLAP